MKRWMVLLLVMVCLPVFAGCSQVPEEPPELLVSWGEVSITAWRGSWSWEWQTSILGARQGVNACGISPLDPMAKVPAVTVGEDEVPLSFAVRPRSVTVTCWNGATGEQGETLELTGNTLPLLEGNWLYEIYASWEEGKFSGDAVYAIRVKRG